MVKLHRSNKKQSKAFTLGEIMAVIVIIGVIAGFAFPNLLYLVLKMKTQESINFLYALYAEQIQFNRENGNFATSFDQLGLDIPNTTSAPYDNVWPMNDTMSCGKRRVGYVTRLGPSGSMYVLSLLEDGTIRCGGNLLTCQKLGLDTTCGS